MRKLILLSLLSAAGMTLVSCMKNYADNIFKTSSEETMNIKVAPNQPYLLNLGDAAGVTISRAPLHSVISEATINNETMSASYKYQPVSGYLGNDEVLLQTTKTVVDYSSGGSCNYGGGSTTTISTKYITVKIQVAD